MKRRIGVAKKAFKDLANILTNRKVKLDTRKRILNMDNKQEYGRETKIPRIMVFQIYAKGIMVR